MIFNEESIQLIANVDVALFEYLIEEAGFKIQNHAKSDINEMVSAIDEAISFTPITDMYKKKGRKPLTPEQIKDQKRRQRLTKEREAAQQSSAEKEVEFPIEKWPMNRKGMRIHPESDEAIQQAYQEMIKKIAEDQGYIIKLLDELQHGIDNLTKQMV